MRSQIVAIILGSDSDLPVMQDAISIFNKAGVSYEIIIASAHRSLRYLQKTIKVMEKRGTKIFIAGAGHSAALPGVIAAETTIPVIGVPIDSSNLKGIDSLYSIVQMPSGIPVATMAIGKSGATNSAILAIEILSINNNKLKKWLLRYRQKLYQDVITKSKLLKQKGYKKYLEGMRK
ncbi:MAG: 5-(carboxyamino)imidazole ribonucleotide mutase [Candidatus Firestonebacteria bacterium]